MAKGGKINRKGRNDGEQYVKLSYRMLRSDAWHALGGPATRVYFELRTRYMGSNNGHLTLSMDEAARLLRMSKTTAKRALVELEEKGFIVMTKRGQWYGRQATEYAVTDKPVNGIPATNAWKHWQTPKTDPRYSGGTVRGANGAASVPKSARRCRVSTRQGHLEG